MTTDDIGELITLAAKIASSADNLLDSEDCKISDNSLELRRIVEEYYNKVSEVIKEK